MASELSPNHNTLLHVFCATNMRFSNTVLDSCNVGYQLIQLGPKFNLFSATFKGVGQDLDLQDIVCTKSDGSAWAASGKSAGKCDGVVFFQKTDRDGNYGTVYSYYSTKDPVGWYYENAQGEFIRATDVKITKDDGMLIQNNQTAGAAFRVSGEVDLNPFVVLPPKFSITGNFTPVEINIQDIECTKPDGTAWASSGKSAGKCDGVVFFQFTDEQGNYGTVYSYYSTKDPVGWYYENAQGEFIRPTDVKLPAGKGILVQNNHTATGAALKLKAPVAEAAK